MQKDNRKKYNKQRKILSEVNENLAESKEDSAKINEGSLQNCEAETEGKDGGTEQNEGVAKNKQSEKGKYSFLFKFLRKTVIFAVIVVILLAFVFKIFRMSGNEMYPYVQDGDFCVFYRLDNLYLGDVVIYEDEEGNECVGRVRAAGGQSVSFNEEGGYSVDNYQPIEENPYETYAAEDSSVTYPLVLEEDEYFILNDFRKLTDDSREIGPVKKSQIKGKLIFILRRRNF